MCAFRKSIFLEKTAQIFTIWQQNSAEPVEKNDAIYMKVILQISGKKAYRKNIVDDINK